MKIKRLLMIIAIFIATFMTSVETTIVTTAMPTIIADLHGLAMQSWVFAVYLLATAITTPIYGKLADQIGRKSVFIFGLTFFIMGTLLAGLSPDMFWLIIFRLIQGIGAGAALPITFVIIADLFTFEERPRVMALNNTAWAISGLIGPLLGGTIVDTLSWHWVFFINVPLGLAVLFITLFAYQERVTERHRAKIDYAGIVSLAITLVALLVIFQNFSATRINWVGEAILAVVMIVALGFFIWNERRVADPLIQFKLFVNRTFLVQILLTLFLSGAIIGMQIYFPIWLQAIYHLPASIAGLAVTPSSILWMIASFMVGGLLTKYAPKKIFMGFIAILIVAYLFLVFSGASFPVWGFFVITALTGGSLGIIITANTLLGQKLVPAENIGEASSMLVLGRTLGQSIMTGVYGLTFTLGVDAVLKRVHTVSFSQENSFISSTSHAVFTHATEVSLSKVTLTAVHGVVWVMVVLFVISLVINFLDHQKDAII